MDNIKIENPNLILIPLKFNEVKSPGNISTTPSALKRSSSTAEVVPVTQFTSPEELSPPTPPDGGWGWLVVFGSFLVNFLIGGLGSSFAILLPNLMTVFGASESFVSWIISTNIACCLFSGPLVGYMVNHFGCRIITIAGTLTMMIGYGISVFAPNIPFLIATYGVVAGVGSGFTYLPCIVAVGMYFEKRRAMATGMAVCGVGAGGLVVPTLVKILVEEYTWRGAMLIIAGLNLHILISGLLFRPLEQANPRKGSSKIILQFNPGSRLSINYVPSEVFSEVNVNIHKVPSNLSNIVSEAQSAVETIQVSTPWKKGSKPIRMISLEETAVSGGSIPITIEIKGVSSENATEDEEIELKVSNDDSIKFLGQLVQDNFSPNVTPRRLTSIVEEEKTQEDAENAKQKEIADHTDHISNSAIEKNSIRSKRPSHRSSTENEESQKQSGEDGPSSAMDFSFMNFPFFQIPKRLKDQRQTATIGESIDNYFLIESSAPQSRYWSKKRRLGNSSEKLRHTPQKQFSLHTVPSSVSLKWIESAGSIPNPDVALKYHPPSSGSFLDIASRTSSVSTRQRFRPMDRKDVLYGSSVLNLDHFESMRRGLAYPQEEGGPDEADGEEKDRMTLIASPTFLLYGIFNAVYLLGQIVPITFIVSFALRMGMPLSDGNMLIGIMGVTNIVFRILIGVLSDAKLINSNLLLSAGMLLSGASVVVCPFLPGTFSAMAIFSVLFTMGCAVWGSLRSVVIVDLFGLECMTEAFGISQLFQGFGVLIGPPIGGLMVRLTGDYYATFISSGLAMITAGIVEGTLNLVAKWESKTKSTMDVPI